jgi:glycerol-3-phosphate dehydrogenase
VRAGGGASTAALSRDHSILIEATGLVTVAGGKWTTYRNMAEDCVDQAAMLARLPERPCVTRELNVHGYHASAERFGHRAVYGAEAPTIDRIAAGKPALAAPLDPALPYLGAEVVHAVRTEMARTVEDVLARRLRALFLDARAAVAAAPRVAGIMAVELGRDAAWQREQVESFGRTAAGFMIARR